MRPEQHDNILEKAARPPKSFDLSITSITGPARMEKTPAERKKPSWIKAPKCESRSDTVSLKF
jgi:hypothetical protein